MATWNAVTSNTTGGVYQIGYTDFTGTFDPADFTQVVLDATTSLIEGLDIHYHKVVGGFLQEMSVAEKAAVDVELKAISDAKLENAARIGKKFANLAALPVPPPEAGLLVAIEDVGGVWAFAYSTNTGYIVFTSDGVYP